MRTTMTNAAPWVLALFLSTSAVAEAQTAPGRTSGPPFRPGLEWTLAWNMAMPTLNTFDWTSNYSFRGISLDARYRLTPSWSAGVSGAWQVFDDKLPERTVTQDNVTVTATEIRHLNFVPLLANVDYYWRGLPLNGEVFAGIGVGTYYVERQRQAGAGLFGGLEKNWHFGFAPEVGLMIPWSKVLFNATVRYNVMFQSNTVPEQTYFSFNLGFTFR